jgi:hypothetical protein
VPTNIRGPAAIKRTIDLKAVHGSALKNELISPSIKRENSQIISLGICLILCQVVLPEKIISDGTIQANRMENLLIKGGQLWMAPMEKKIIKIVEIQKDLRAQLRDRTTASPEGDDLNSEGIKKFKSDNRFCWLN